MIWRIVLALVFACAVGAYSRPTAAQTPFPERVAARCAGEARFALQECACVVKNRLLGGFTENTVLRPFFAPDQPVTAEEIAQVERVLNGYWPCDPRVWYMFSVQDCRRLGLPEGEAVQVVRGPGRWRVLFYDKAALDD